MSRVELLFVTLSQANPAQSLVASLFATPFNGARHDKATLAICEKAAEQGLPTAQIADTIDPKIVSTRHDPFDECSGPTTIFV